MKSISKQSLRALGRNTRKLVPVALLLAWSITSASNVRAHMPWLGADADGKLIVWFGESMEDRTYHMPDSIASIQIHQDNPSVTVATEPVDEDELIGLRSIDQVASGDEAYGSVTYGLYHGLKLTYHIEHLLSANPKTWPSEPRADAPLQSIVTPNENGGVNVQILRDGQGVGDTSVKLLCAGQGDGTSQTTDAKGNLVFAAKSIHKGLCALTVGLNDKDAKGDFKGEPYSGAADYLTATFYYESKDSEEAEENEGSQPDQSARVEESGLPDLPEELTSFGAAILDHKLYVYGGHTGSAHSYSNEEQSDRLWSLNLKEAGQEWKKLQNGPRLQGLALVAHGDRLVRIGGFTAMNDVGEEHDLQSQTDVASYDPQSDAWSALAALPEPRSSLDAAVLGDKVYVFGGWSLQGGSDGSGWHKSAWSLDLSNPNASWEPLAEPPFQRRALSVAAFDGKLYVIGGMQPKGGPTTRVDVYDPETNQWSQAPSIPGAGMSGFGSSAFAFNGQLYVSTYDGNLNRLSEDGSKWIITTKAERERFFHRMIPDGNKRLLLVGGANMQSGKFLTIDQAKLSSDSE